MPYLKVDIEKKWVQAKAGDEIKIRSDHGDMWVAETMQGERFGVRKEDVQEAPLTFFGVILPEPPKKVQKIVAPVVKKKVAKKVDKPNTQTLF